MYDYNFEYLAGEKEITDEVVDRQIAIAQNELIQHLDITLDEIGRRKQVPNVSYDGKLGTRIEYLVSKDGAKLQWLTVFYDSQRSYLKVSSELYLGVPYF